MIGVIAPNSDPRVVEEFFELFKTPWEQLRQGRVYDAILCVGDARIEYFAAKVVILYASRPIAIDAEEEKQAFRHEESEIVLCNGRTLALCGEHLIFAPADLEHQTVDVQQLSYHCEREGAVVHRIGYDLFAEAGELLTNGQPDEYAPFPTLEIHIALLREMIVDCGVELLEIPPVPQGYGCIACLTHDIDHPAIRNHRWDGTAFGFLYRATVGSLTGFLRGRVTFQSLIKNWVAAAKLPLVYAGVAKDFWSGYEERYFFQEQGHRSTYFVIPFKNNPGKSVNGLAPKRRAARYAAVEISDALKRITMTGCEVGLHGIDAWIDCAAARRELNEVRRLTDGPETGVRMHWLFFHDESPAILEQAGASYDSTIGYRETVGFRSGALQAYKPLGARRLLELPLHLIDTALFYPAYLGYSQRQAEARVREMIEAAVEFGGCLTINWHDRSLAAERNWVECYRFLLDELRMHNAWFATTGEATSWFRMRRSVVFREDATTPQSVRAEITQPPLAGVPGLRVRLHKSEKRAAADGNGRRKHVDAPLAYDSEINKMLSA